MSDPARQTRLVVLISGSGSNLQAILDACADGRLNAAVVGVLSNRRKAFGLVRAERAAVPTRYVPLGPWRRRGQTRTDYDADVAEQVTALRPDLVVLAGWMHILGTAFLDRFPGRVLNLHPALPGAFPGTDAIARALAAFQRNEIRATGVMVHHVIPEVDAGPVVATADVPILADDDLDALAARMHAAEHQLLVDAIAQVAAELQFSPLAADALQSAPEC